MIKEAKKSFVRALAGLAMAAAITVMLPAAGVKADVVAADAPKDAAQTLATDSAVQVSWTKKAGLTYYYSYSVDGKKTFTAETATTEGVVNIAPAAGTFKPGNTYYVKIRSNNGSKYSSDIIIPVATCPKSPATIKQTEATSTTASISWDKCEGATGYVICIGESASTVKKLSPITTTSAKITSLSPDKKYFVSVLPIRKVTDKYAAQNDAMATKKNDLRTTAAAVTGLKLSDWDVRNNIVTVAWDNKAVYENGYQLEIYAKDGTTLLKNYYIYGRRVNSKNFKLAKIKNKPFQYRVRTYTLINGVKSFGDWSALAVAVPQANVKATKVSDTSIKLTWDKIDGTTNYTIYRATKDGGKYKKVATVKKNNYVVKNLTAETDYYFYVRANKVAVAGKKVNSTKLNAPNDIYTYISPISTVVTED